ncbi:MAG TPA: type II toxin-antitoxin system RelE/ParE family toxin [Thauera sp.]|nr:type II toxin-antitoxin system RelE/ParE family toxin [Thauera sp.]HRA82119.1 type II toxin-antitoxin system RelE/ParE family toxin [Thauera sp.]
MSKIRHSTSAENDLLEAWLFVAEDSVEATDRLLDQIQAESQTLLLQPKIGQARDELAVDLRGWPTLTPYILFYFVEDDGITVARVLHHARDVPAIWNWPRHGGRGRRHAL